MSKKLILQLYGKNLRDFINNDLKIIRTPTKYLFVSKKQNYIFRSIDRIGEHTTLCATQMYQLADFIFSDIEHLRKTHNEAF